MQPNATELKVLPLLATPDKTKRGQCGLTVAHPLRVSGVPTRPPWPHFQRSVRSKPDQTRPMSHQFNFTPEVLPRHSSEGWNPACETAERTRGGGAGPPSFPRRRPLHNPPAGSQFAEAKSREGPLRERASAGEGWPKRETARRRSVTGRNLRSWSTASTRPRQSEPTGGDGIMVLQQWYDASDEIEEALWGPHLVQAVRGAASRNVPDHSTNPEGSHRSGSWPSRSWLVSSISRQTRHAAGRDDSGRQARRPSSREQPARNETDPDAAWTRKGGKSHFGYKAISLDAGSGLIQAVFTPANEGGRVGEWG